MKKTQTISKYVDPKKVGLELAKEVKKMENVEDLGTAIYHTNNQMYLLIQEILRKKFEFSEKDLKELHQEATRAVEGLAWFEDKGLSPMSLHSIGQLVDVTLNHFEQFKAARAGIELPSSPSARKLLENKK